MLKYNKTGLRITRLQIFSKIWSLVNNSLIQVPFVHGWHILLWFSMAHYISFLPNQFWVRYRFPFTFLCFLPLNHLALIKARELDYIYLWVSEIFRPPTLMQWYDNAIFYSNTNEHALGHRHRNRYHGRLCLIYHQNDCGDDNLMRAHFHLNKNSVIISFALAYEFRRLITL